MPKILTVHILTLGLMIIFMPSELLSTTSVYIGLEIKVHPELEKDFTAEHYSKERLKRHLFKQIEKKFGENKIAVEAGEKYCDFSLKGVLYAKHFDDNADSFSIRFTVEDMEIVPSNQFLPSLIYSPLDTGGGKFSDELFEAVNFAIEDFIQSMIENDVFNFLAHPVFRKIARVKKKDLEQKTIDQLKKLVKDMIEDVKVAIHVAIKTELSKIKQFPVQNFITELKEMERRLKKLYNKEQSEQKMIQEILKFTRRMNYRNYASIVIKIHHVGAVGDTFPAVIRPDKDCEECRYSIIKAVNLAKIKKIANIKSYAQEAKYFNYFLIDGKFSKDRKSIILSLKDYKDILIIDENSYLEPQGEILRSVRQKNHPYPRILVLEGK